MGSHRSEFEVLISTQSIDFSYLLFHSIKIALYFSIPGREKAILG